MPTYVQYYEPFDILTRASSTFTICIPAILPIVMIMGIMFGLRRLYTHDIYCTSPMKINTAGRVSMIVFDKTGTLTNDGLNAVGHKISFDKGFKPTIKRPEEIIDDDNIWTNKTKYESL